MRSARTNILLIDLAGGAVCAACLLGAAWALLLRADTVQDTVRASVTNIESMHKDLAKLQATIETQQAVVKERRAALTESGKLPEFVAAEKDLSELWRIAEAHGVSILQLEDLPAAHYPGILEVRYALQAEGEWAALLGFLRAIEVAELWSDVGFLQIDQNTSRAGSTSTVRRAQLTLSMFSAPLNDGTPGAGPAPATPRSGAGGQG